MKRIVNTLSIVGFVCGLILLSKVYSSTIPPPAVPLVESPGTSTFASFPVDQPRLVTFDVDAEDSGSLTGREQRDQALDWLLFTALSDAGLSVEQFNEITFDLPPRRYGYLRPVANFEYGLTRSRFIGDGKVVALIPAASTAEERSDHLAHVFDEHRKNLGEAPNTILAFDYQIDLDDQSARVTRRGAVGGKELLSGKYGYFETELKSLGDLTRFVAAIDDITFARLQGDHLVLGGRKLQTPKHLGMQVEDIAALWQSEKKLHARLDDFKQRLEREEAAFEARWRGRTYQSKSEGQRLKREHDSEWEALADRYQAERAELHLVEGSGFSLDPTYDFERLAEFFAKVEPVLRKNTGEAGDPITSGEIDAAREGIGEHNADRMLELLDKMAKSGNPNWVQFSEYVEELSRTFQFQVARYDGDLSGTQVGMTLFYTDLLAKLWALDFLQSAPMRKVEDFRPMTVVSVSPIFEQEINRLRGTRLWFGHQDSGFQVTENRNTIVLARNATRVYAASSNLLEPGKEEEPNAQSEAFLGWWNDHYEEVARYEPEYTRLNQIMKWSLLLGWLNAADQGQLLGFLADARVTRSLWFPEWASRHTDLKFTNWTKVGFYPKNYKGIATEAMPILASERYRLFQEPQPSWTLSGGVSLAPKQLFKERPAPTPATAKLLRRSNLDYASLDNAAKAFKTFGGANYRLTVEAPGRVSVTASAKDGAKLRTSVGELGIGRFERTVFHSDIGLAVETSAGGKAIGDLRIAKTSNGFAIGWRGRAVDTGHALGRRVSRSLDIRQALLADPDIEALVQLPGKDQFAVKIRGSEGWLKLAPEDHPSATLAKGWDARVSDPLGGKQNIQLAWTQDSRRVVDGFEGDGFLVVESGAWGGKAVLRYEAPRGPPPAEAEILTFSGDGVNLNGWAKRGDGTVRLRWGDLKATASSDPIGLATRIARVDSKGAFAALNTGTQKIQVALPRTGSLDEPAIVRSLNGNNYHEAARAIATEPGRATAQINEYLSQELQINRTLMAEQRYVKAIQHIEGLIERYGPIPDLTLRKGVAQLSRAKVQRAAEALREVAGRPLRDRGAFFDEINARVKNAAGSVDSKNLARFADYAEWQDLQARRIIPPVRVLPVVDGDHLRLHLHSAQAVSGDAVSSKNLANIRPDIATLYVQDTPGLNNLDWSVSLSQGLREIPSGKLPVVIKLDNVPISHFRPDVIFSPDGATHYNLANKGDVAQHLRGDYGSSTKDCSNESSPACNQEQGGKPVYLVRAKS